MFRNLNLRYVRTILMLWSTSTWRAGAPKKALYQRVLVAATQLRNISLWLLSWDYFITWSVSTLPSEWGWEIFFILIGVAYVLSLQFYSHLFILKPHSTKKTLMTGYRWNRYVSTWFLITIDKNKVISLQNGVLSGQASAITFRNISNINSIRLVCSFGC